MIRIVSKLFPVTVALTVAVSCLPDALVSAPAAVTSISPTGNGGPLIQQDFNQPGAWKTLSATSTARITVNAAQRPVGTIDNAGSTTPSGAALLTIGGVAKTRAWSAAITSGLLPVRTTETNLSKLTLSFDHSVSAVRPVLVQVESFDARKHRTGGRQGIVYPAAADFYLRSALELSTMQPFGTGVFRPTDPYVRITFTISNASAPAKEKEAELRIDNVAYATPAFYVSPKGDDANDGRTEKTAFANPQRAVDAAQPGDIILLKEGTYQRPTTDTAQQGTILFRQGGTPAAWIVVKNYPGQHPILTSDAWNTIKIGRGDDKTYCTEPALAYIEVRGLHIRGNALVAKEKFATDIGKSVSTTNTNGISVDGRFETNAPHHIRISDNLVEYCCAAGIGAGEGDWITVENNVSRNNCWWTIYACSGISFITTANFDAADNIYKDLIRNNVVSGNRCFMPWEATHAMSDGNGIIVDSNDDPKKNKSHRGRTLVQNNLSYNNGGSGIHAFHSHRVDIINNTAYYNGATPELNWGQIFVQESDDARIMNNILVSRPGQPINSIGPDGGDQNSTKVVRSGNIYFGGLTPKHIGYKDILSDPLFVHPSTDFSLADFHLRPGSPALKAGISAALVPLRDLDGKPRGNVPSRGSYDK